MDGKAVFCENVCLTGQTAVDYYTRYYCKIRCVVRGRPGLDAVAAFWAGKNKMGGKKL